MLQISINKLYILVFFTLFLMLLLFSCNSNKSKYNVYQTKIDSIYEASYRNLKIDSSYNSIDSIILCDTVKIFRYWYSDGGLNAIGTYYTSLQKDSISTFNPDSFNNIIFAISEFKVGIWLYYDKKGKLLKREEYKKEQRIPISNFF